MLVSVIGEWHKPLQNEPVCPRGWRKAFRMVAGEAPPEGLHCALVVAYKCAESLFRDSEVLEAASTGGVAKAVMLVAQKIRDLREEVVRIDPLPLQVAAAAVLSMGLASDGAGGLANITPLMILRRAYGGSEVRLLLDPQLWPLVKKAANLDPKSISPREAEGILSGEKAREVVNLLKIM